MKVAVSRGLTVFVEEGVPCPPARGGKVWPFAQMRTGDSFSVGIEEDAHLRASQSEFNAEMRAAGDTRRITVRKMDSFTVRAWMVEEGSTALRVARRMRF